MKKSDLLLYEIMKYPKPKNWEIFSTEKKTEISSLDLNENFSWEKEDPLMEEYRLQIKKHKKIFESLPWVRNIYLCNSITFNKLNENSDIDLFIITKKNSIRRARLASALIFFVLGLKRSRKSQRKKYCLSFYVTEDNQNLYNISLAKTDIYLAYWLAHLVPIYQEGKSNKSIYDYNQRIQPILPNFPKQHIIKLNIPLYEGNNKIKIFFEKYIGGILGKIVEYLIKVIRIPILIYKTKRLKGSGQNIIFNDIMLKFYKDKRQKIALLYRTQSQLQSQENNG